MKRNRSGRCDMDLKKMERQYNTGIFSRERVLALTLLIATALGFYLCYLLIYPFLPPLAWALALAVVAHPLHEWLARRIQYPNVAAGLAVFIVAVTIVGPALFVTEKLVNEALA